MDRPFAPVGFEPPRDLVAERFVLEPLGPEHNERDHAAWMSSIEHIHRTPGYDDDPSDDDPWPTPLTLAQNLADLEAHARDFRDREGFTYTVLDPESRDVIGCVYIYPPTDDAHDARVQSWVRESHADLDAPLWRAVSDWLASPAWPFRTPSYAPRT